MKRFLVQLAVVLLFAGMSAHLCAQSQNARVGGTVVDAGGALIPGAEITATNDATGVVTTVVSNETGNYQFASCSRGRITVTACCRFSDATYKQVL
jgi:hypothetical protein